MERQSVSCPGKGAQALPRLFGPAFIMDTVSAKGRSLRNSGEMSASLQAPRLAGHVLRAGRLSARSQVQHPGALAAVESEVVMGMRLPTRRLWLLSRLLALRTARRLPPRSPRRAQLQAVSARSLASLALLPPWLPHSSYRGGRWSRCCCMRRAWSWTSRRAHATTTVAHRCSRLDVRLIAKSYRRQRRSFAPAPPPPPPPAAADELLRSSLEMGHRRHLGWMLQQMTTIRSTE